MCSADAASRRASLGWFTAALLAGVLAASFFVDADGHGAARRLRRRCVGLFFQRLFLVAGILGVLGAIDWLADAHAAAVRASTTR